MVSETALSAANKFLTPKHNPIEIYTTDEGGLDARVTKSGVAGLYGEVCIRLADSIDENINDNKKHLGKKPWEMRKRLTAVGALRTTGNKVRQGGLPLWLAMEAVENLTTRRRKCEKRCNGGERITTF